MKLFFRTLTMVLIALLSISAIGCGGDEEEPENEKKPEATKEPSAEDLVGSWAVVSIGGESVQETVDLFDEDEVKLSLEIISNNFVFAANSSWAWTFGVQISIDLPAEGIVQKLKERRTLKGTYAVSGSTLSLILDSVDVKYEPRAAIVKILDITEEQLVIIEENEEEELTSDFGAIDNATYSIQGNTLTLTSSDGKGTFKKQ